MRSATALSLWVAASAVEAFTARTPAVKNVVPGAYIFEFEDSANTNSVLDELKSKGTQRLKLDYDLFKGVSIQLHDVENAAQTVRKLAKSPAVKQVWPVQVYKLPKGKVQAARHQIGKSGILSRRAAKEVDNYSTHVMTGVDKMHAAGYHGEGINIAIVDTGTDYNHPALGNKCFGKPQCLVTKGYDLVGDAYNGYNTPMPDNDPMDCQGHGTHVAGIVAAQPNPYNFTGTAYGAKLFSYKVFGCEGDVGNDVLIAAYNRAYQDGADIITASIGGPSGWSEDPWAAVVTRIVQKGVPCTIAAGNEGDQGIFYASGAADAKGALSIASFDNVITPSITYASDYIIDGKTTEFSYAPGNPEAWQGVKLPIYAVTNDTTVTGDACNALPSNTPDLSKYIVLIRRGSCTFVQKATNVAAHGAKYIMLYNNVDGAFDIDVSAVNGIVASGMVPPANGASWIKAIKAGKTVTLSMKDRQHAKLIFSTSPNAATGGALSTFTTWGPTYEMDVKPQFGAVGGNVLSTYPLALGSYAILSGTSMATPQAAGIVALVAQKRGTLYPSELEKYLSSSANPQLFNIGSGFYNFKAPVMQQGNGLVNAYDAAYDTSQVTPSSLSFNDTEHFAKTLSFTILNSGDGPATYTVSHVPSATFYSLGTNGSIYVDLFPNEPVEIYTTLKFSQSSNIYVRSGQEKTISVTSIPPVRPDKNRLPVYNGWIVVNGTDGSSLSIPYQGVTGSLRKAVVLGPDDAILSTSADVDPVPAAAGTKFTLPPQNPLDPGTGNYTLPTIVFQLAMGSRKVRADIEPQDKTVKTTDFFGTKTIGQPQSFPQLYLPRGLATTPWDGQLADGGFAPAGSFKIAIRALRIFGDESNKSDWDLVETVNFSIRYDDS